MRGGGSDVLACVGLDRVAVRSNVQNKEAHVGQVVADRTPNSAHTNASVTRLTL